MFGYITICRPELKVKEYDTYPALLRPMPQPEGALWAGPPTDPFFRYDISRHPAFRSL